MRTIKILAILVPVICLPGILLSAPVGTAFTYQGRLIDANSAAEGFYDFQFKLFDANSGGTQAGGDVNKPDVDIIDGYFTVELDFGNVFTGEARWIEIGVREGDSNDVFTVLSPRQKITAAPYALYAASGTGGPIEVGKFDGVVNSDMVETDPEGITTINFENPFTTTEPPQFYVSVVLKQAANGLVEGTAIKAVEDIKGAAGNWTGFDLAVSKYSDGSSIDDMTEVYVRWIAVSKTGTSSTSSVQTDIVTGSIPYDNNPGYIVDIGLVKDVSSEIPSGFTLVAVVATGYKVDEMSGSRIGEPPLTLEPKVNGTSIEIRVWDAACVEYGGSGWSGMTAHVDYTLFMKKSGASSIIPHEHDERYYTKTEVDTMLADKADKTEVDKKYAVFAGNLDGTPFEASFPAEWAGFTKVEVTATGYKYNTMDSSKQGPLIVTATVDTGNDKITFEVWDTSGSQYGGSGWAGNEAHIDFVAFGTK